MTENAVSHRVGRGCQYIMTSLGHAFSPLVLSLTLKSVRIPQGLPHYPSLCSSNGGEGYRGMSQHQHLDRPGPES